ncbi:MULTISPECIES: carbohydrate ABC transporter permease [unclassified Microbacterium]|uniref:carbohydrate ABC transporter permease n=1 Tax=unclassified Microbacterium TaxID=2609290 RepID=UPI000CFC0D5D|nr:MULTISPECIES: sugar ABC transporter permease [unclassified Microbacterium]PQZ50938.1 ABC transporter permease [Microbacterium sp. MYb43]PQZ72698.1 ABC transporter permease [Microbacterium sp. MYb40]PRB16436.1 ABC transporter permease [Microbacterium sp. MYb54]PRB31419.1 ABC transporter permease [Microbacterium sp. MYb50]PRB67702.1 ABC transporter permease [Microbacterium sp. MYb32]
MPHQKTVARRPRRRATGWSFVALYAVLLVVFGIIPVVYAVVTAFFVTPVIGPTYFSLIDNFVAVLSDYRLPVASLNVGMYLLLWLPLLLIVVFVIALVLDAKRTRFGALTRFVTYVPGAITGSAAALLWLFMFSPAVSPIGPLLAPFVGDNGIIISDASLPVILAVMGVAIGAGGWIVMLYGALTALPAELIEAARIDGANIWQQVWHIKLPMLRSYIAFILIVSLAAGFQVFVEPQVLGAGARGQVSSTWSVNQIVYSYAAGESNYGRASALSVILLIITVTAAVIIIRKTKFYSIDGRS